MRFLWIVALASALHAQASIPQLSLANFTAAEGSTPLKNVPASLKRWLASSVDRDWNETLQYSYPGLTAAERAEQKKEILAALTVFELPVKAAGEHLYLVNHPIRPYCGATGNCTLELVEESRGAVRSIASESGWGYDAPFREGAAYPDVFISTHMSARETAISGYVRTGAAWKRVYCGAIATTDDGKETADIRLCQ
jgi:hypothetical protein